MTVATLKAKTERLRHNLESLKSQLASLEKAEPSDDLAVEVQRQAALQTARELIVERAAELQAQEQEIQAAEAEEAREKQLAQLTRRAAKGAERYNDAVMALIGALSELNAINDEHIAAGAGVLFAAVGVVKIPPRVVQNDGCSGYHMGTSWND